MKMPEILFFFFVCHDVLNSDLCDCKIKKVSHDFPSNYFRLGTIAHGSY